MLATTLNTAPGVALSVEPPIECPHTRVSGSNPNPPEIDSSLSISPPKNINLARPTGKINKSIRLSFSNSIKYTLKTWYPYCFGNQTGPIKPNGIDQRAISTASYAVAVAVKTGAYVEKEVGISEKSAIIRAKQLLLGASLKHVVHNGNKGDTWGHSWQSSYWAFYFGTAGWLLYDDLTPSERQIVAMVVESEANYQLSKGNDLVAYYATSDDVILTPGDTKAEENAWNSTVLSIAKVMMPTHKNAHKWRAAEAELQIASYARQSDADSEELVNGKPLKEWINGWNVHDDGTVINHSILSPEYMGNISLKLNGVQLTNLAGRQGLLLSSWNADLIYSSFIFNNYSSPQYALPGGTVYTPGSYEIYFPEGNDWGTGRISNYLALDVFANSAELDKKFNAETWMKLHLERQNDMQSRFIDGRTYSGKSDDINSEYTYSGREQVTAGDLAQTWLWQYLDHNSLLQISNSPTILTMIEPPMNPLLDFFIYK